MLVEFESLVDASVLVEEFARLLPIAVGLEVVVRVVYFEHRVVGENLAFCFGVADFAGFHLAAVESPIVVDSS